MDSDICTKNNLNTRFSPGVLNTINFTVTHLKYITLIMKKKYQFIKM